MQWSMARLGRAKMRTLVLAFCALASTAGAQEPVRPAPFDFKGVALGISIDEMRQTRTADESARPARLVCTGDDVVTVISFLQIHVEGAEAELGVRRCAYFQPPQSPQSDLGIIAFLSMGGDEFASYTYHFDFFADPATGEYRLYRIWLLTSADAEHDIVAALRDKFGAAARTTTDAVQTGFGAIIPRRSTTWRNAVSSITVQSPHGQLDEMVVVYRLTALADHVDDLVRRHHSAAPNRM